MKIGLKILMSFLVIIVSIGVMGFISLTSSQERIINEIGEDHAETLHDAIMELDENFKEKVFGLIVNSDRSFVIEFLNSSSTSGVPLENNALSIKLQESSNFLEAKYGFPIYEDAFIVNSTGNTIAYVGSSPDSSYNDAPWWNSVVNNGVFLGEIIFDDTLQIYTRDVAVRIDDNQRNFVGVLHTKINLQHLLLTINDLKQSKKFQNSEILLVSKSGLIIFSTISYEKDSYVPSADGIAMLASDSSYFIRTGVLGTDSVLHAYSKSVPTTDFPSLGWSLVVKRDGGEVLGPVIGLTNTILIVSMTTIISAVVVANYVRTSISNPLIKLKNASSQIAAGDFDVQLDIKTDDEVGELASKFELMRDNVHFTNENLRDLIKMRTTELKTAMDDLKNNELWTDELMDFVSDKFQTPLQSLFENIELIRQEKISPEKALQEIEDTTQKLKMLTGDFIDLYNIDKNKTEFEMKDVFINPIITDVVNLYLKTPKPGVELQTKLSDDVKIFADAPRLKRVLSNLISHSLKSTSEGFVRIETNLTLDQKSFEIKISDSRGPIEGELSDLFGSLKKEPKPDDGDSEFGLIISKSIITEHAGDLQLLASDSGLIISIRLPIFGKI